MNTPTPRQIRTLDNVNVADFDFIDFGAGIGDSLVRCEEKIGGRGLGVEKNIEKVAEAQTRGLEVVYGDITDLPAIPSFKYVVMDNLLEHLPSLESVRTVIQTATDISREFIYIRHPSFEDEAYLRGLKLKQYWTDWSGHPTHILLADFSEIFRSLGLGLWEVRFVEPAIDSTHSSILPLSAPRDQHSYKPELHGPKPHVRFDHPVYRVIDIFVPSRTLGNSITLRGPTSAEGNTDTRPTIDPAESPLRLSATKILEWRSAAAAREADNARYQDQLARIKRRRALKIADSAGRLLRVRPLKRGFRAVRRPGDATTKRTDD